MVGLAAPGSVVWLSKSEAATRKYPHTWELVEADLGNGATLVGINPMQPNRLVAEAIAAGGIKKLSGYETLRREVKYGEASRIDLLLEDARKGRCYVEVKNVHLMRAAGRAEFPDGVTTRGAKHLRELSAMVAQGHRAVMLYLIQRADAESFSIADDFDAAYAEAFKSGDGCRRRGARLPLPPEPRGDHRRQGGARRALGACDHRRERAGSLRECNAVR